MVTLGLPQVTVAGRPSPVLRCRRCTRRTSNIRRNSPNGDKMTTSDRDGVGLLEPVPSLVLNGLDEPAFAAKSWLDGHSGTLVDHPLLRGLLLELPSKSAPPSPEWMDRWFEAARAVLDLVYNRR